eukprot:8992963-Pyramimonas_sp.AAC.1
MCSPFRSPAAERAKAGPFVERDSTLPERTDSPAVSAASDSVDQRPTAHAYPPSPSDNWKLMPPPREGAETGGPAADREKPMREQPVRKSPAGGRRAPIFRLARSPRTRSWINSL